MEPKIKARIRIPTDQYAFIEIEVEDTPEKIIETYYNFTRELKPKEGLPDKEWREALDGYLAEGKMTVVEYNGMSERQQWLIQQIKKSVKRVKSKIDK